MVTQEPPSPTHVTKIDFGFEKRGDEHNNPHYLPVIVARVTDCDGTTDKVTFTADVKTPNAEAALDLIVAIAQTLRRNAFDMHEFDDSDIN